MARRLLREEGLFVGGSSGLNVAAAEKVARELGPGHTIVTLLCDGGQRYLGSVHAPAEQQETVVTDVVTDVHAPNSKS